MRFLFIIASLLAVSVASAENVPEYQDPPGEEMETNFEMKMTTDSGTVYSFNSDFTKEVSIKLPGAISAQGWVCVRGATVLSNAGDKYYTAFTCSNDEHKSSIGAVAACLSSEESSDASRFDLIVRPNNTRVAVTFSAVCHTNIRNRYGI